MTSDVRWDTFSLASDAGEDFENMFASFEEYKYTQRCLEMVSCKLSQHLAAMEEGAKFIGKLKTTLVECGVLVRSISFKLSELEQFSHAGIHQDLELDSRTASKKLFPFFVAQLDLISLKTSENMDKIEDLDLFSLRSVSIPEYFEFMMSSTDRNVELLRTFSSQLDCVLIRFRRHVFRNQQGRLHSGIFSPVASRRVSICANFIITSAAKPFPSFVIDVAPLFF
jgi:hypothetical protein